MFEEYNMLLSEDSKLLSEESKLMLLSGNNDLFNMADEIISNYYDIYAYVASKIFKKPYEECTEYSPDGSYNPVGSILRNIATSVEDGMSVWDISKRFGCPKLAELITSAFPYVNPAHVAEGCCCSASVALDYSTMFITSLTGYVRMKRMMLETEKVTATLTDKLNT